MVFVVVVLFWGEVGAWIGGWGKDGYRERIYFSVFVEME